MKKYQLHSLPGRFSGLHMVCLMYAAFKIIDPTADIGFDLAKEYALAKQMRRDQKSFLSLQVPHLKRLPVPCSIASSERRIDPRDEPR